MANIGFNKDTVYFYKKYPLVKSGKSGKSNKIKILVEKFTFEIYEKNYQDFKWVLLLELDLLDVWWDQKDYDLTNEWVTFNHQVEKEYTWLFKTKLGNQVFIRIENDDSISYFIK